MVKVGESFIATLKETHLDWGDSPRRTESRPRRSGENYIPITSEQARTIGIYNSNYATGLGNNIFKAYSVDGLFEDEVKVSGNKVAGDIYAKNLHVNGDLKGFKDWFRKRELVVDDQIKVTWVSSDTIELEVI